MLVFMSDIAQPHPNRRGRQRLDLDVDALWSAYQETGSAAKVAERFGCDQSTVIDRLRNAGRDVLPPGTWPRPPDWINPLRGRELPQETIDKIRSAHARKARKREIGRAQMLKNRASGDPKFTAAYGGRHRHGRRPDLSDVYFRSSWEANYARYLRDEVTLGRILRWEFEPDTFWFEAIRRGVRSYLPDFKVWPIDGGAPYYVEIKGYMDAKSATKIKRMAKYHPTIVLKVVDAKLYKILDARCRDRIPFWEK